MIIVKDKKTFLLPRSSIMLKKKDTAVWVGKGTGNGPEEKKQPHVLHETTRKIELGFKKKVRND